MVTPVVVASPAASGTVPQVDPKTVPTPPNLDLNDFSDMKDHEWNLDDEAESSDFEIDADASAYYMPLGNAVTFKAKALNGTPPFTFTWDFNDGSPPATGEMVKHVFVQPGEREVRVIGKDASGATAATDLGLLIAVFDDFAARMQLDQ